MSAGLFSLVWAYRKKIDGVLVVLVALDLSSGEREREKAGIM